MANWDMKWYAEIAWVRYDGVWDSNMKLKECTYKGVKLKLRYIKWQYSLVNNNGNTLPLYKNYNAGLVSARIAKAISIVKYSGYQLDYFESDGPILYPNKHTILQADYNNKAIDTDLFKDTKRTLWIDARTLAQRLNKSRSEWWI